jgi:hypothetical protein
LSRIRSHEKMTVETLDIKELFQNGYIIGIIEEIKN